jgi:hypothetical protein
MQRCALGLFAAVWALSSPAIGADAPRVSLELLTQPGLPITASQQWYKALSELGISGLQIRSAGPADEAGVTEQGGRSGTSYRVVGILSADNMLHLPGGTFKVNDTAGLRKWLATLSDQGAAGVTERRSAFGLLAKQLAAAHDDLAHVVAFSTKDTSAAQTVSRIAATLKYSLQLDAADRRRLEQVIVADDLSGLSAGTVLADVLRGAGLVFRPERPAGGDLQYRVEEPRTDRESWPVGWKPKGRANEVLPALFDYLNVEISDTSVADALEAIQGRLKVPCVFDRAAMKLHDVDPASAQASVPAKRMTYSLILNKILLQSKLKYELRVDEAQQPFLWITTVKTTH